jgi:hypothetical protein
MPPWLLEFSRAVSGNGLLDQPVDHPYLSLAIIGSTSQRGVVDLELVIGTCDGARTAWLWTGETFRPQMLAN